MSQDAVTAVAPESQEAADLFPGTAQHTLGGQPVEISNMKVGKMLLALEVVSELLENDDLSALVTGQLTQADLIKRLLPNLPSLIRTARPVLQRAIALIVTPDAEVADLEDAGTDIRVEMERRGRSLFKEAELTEVINVLASGIKALGIDALAQALPNLTGAITQTTN